MPPRACIFCVPLWLDRRAAVFQLGRRRVVLHAAGRGQSLFFLTPNEAGIQAQYGADFGVFRNLRLPGEIGLTVSKSLRKDPAVKPGFTQAQAQELGQRFGVNIDMRDGLEVVDDLRKKGINAVPVVLPGDDLLHNNKQPDGSTKSFINIHGAELMPLGNIAGTVTVMCNEGGSWITYETDEHGFNNPKGIWPAGFDIAAVGDSHAQGYCVPADKNFVALLRNQGSTIVNLGMGGNGPLLELASLKEYVQPSKPKVVLWFYSEGTDLYDLQLEKKSKLLMNYLQDGFTQNLIQRQDDIDKAIADEIPKQMERRRKDFSSGSVAHFLHGMKDSDVPVKQQPSRGPRVLDTLMATVKLSSLRERLGLVYGTDTAEVERLADLEGTNVDLFRDVLAHAHASVQAWGGALYFVYVPSWKYYIPDNPTKDVRADFGMKERARVLSLIEGLGIPIIDIKPVLEAQKDPPSLFPFRRPNHYNELGHRLIADSIIKSLSHSQQAAVLDHKSGARN